MTKNKFLRISTVFLLFFSLAFFPFLSPVSAQEQEATNINNYSLDTLDPLKVGSSGNITVEQDLSTPGGIISRVLVFAFPFAGMILFVMLIWGGFETLGGAATKKSMDAGRQRITAAIIGFILLFTSYWIMQIIEIVFGVKIFF